MDRVGYRVWSDNGLWIVVLSVDCRCGPYAGDILRGWTQLRRAYRYDMTILVFWYWNIGMIRGFSEDNENDSRLDCELSEDDQRMDCEAKRIFWYYNATIEFWYSGTTMQQLNSGILVLQCNN